MGTWFHVMSLLIVFSMPLPYATMHLVPCGVAWWFLLLLYPFTISRQNRSFQYLLYARLGTQLKTSNVPEPAKSQCQPARAKIQSWALQFCEMINLLFSKYQVPTELLTLAKTSHFVGSCFFSVALTGPERALTDHNSCLCFIL